MEGYVSRRATLKCNISPLSVVLGPSLIGPMSLIDSFTVIGYPARSKLLQSSGDCSPSTLDKLSKGAKVGSSCVIRSGSVVYESVELGDNVELGHSVLVREGSIVGEGTRIGSNSQLDGRVEIGENCSIQSSVYLPNLTKVGNNVFIGPAAIITNDKYPPSRRLEGVVIEDEVVIGAGAVIIAGIRIGRGAAIAAGSVVTKDVEEYSVVRGCPAKVVGKREDYEAKRIK